MNKKKLALILSKLDKLNSYNINLEQYMTDSELAAEILWLAFLNNDIEGKIIADLGCGNGILGIGALILGAKKVYFLDKDKEAINITKKNCLILTIKGIFLNQDIEDFDKKVDCVIMNPPFGVQNRKADKLFLEKAFKYSKKIYSFHKIESQNFIKKIASENLFDLNKIIEFDFLIKKTMRFHKKNKYFVRVGCFILKRKI